MKTPGRNKPHLAIPYTKRDVLILYSVFTVRYMTTPQIWKLFFTNASMLVCNQRLKKLVDYGLLRVIEQAIKRGEGRKPFIYALTPLGGELLTYERGVDAKLINVKPWADEGNSLKLKHILATTDFLIAIHEACRTGEYTLDGWETEREIRAQLTKETVRFAGPDGQEYRTPIPDLLFTLKRGEKRAIYFVEIDRATENLSLSPLERQSVAGKVIEFLQWEGSDQYRAAYFSRPLRVLFVTTGSRRMRNMKSAAERVIGQLLAARSELTETEKQAEFIRLGKRFRFITTAEVQPDTLLTEPVWQVAGDDGAHTMID